jgi:hypothetical protein
LPGSGGLLGSGGAPSSGGSSASGGNGGCSPVTHSTGLGPQWVDCTALGTHDEEQATKACDAWCAANGGCACGICGLCVDDSDRICANLPGASLYTSWAFEGPNAGTVAQSFFNSGSCIVSVTQSWN